MKMSDTESELLILRMAMMQAWNAIVVTTADQENGYPVLTANPAFSGLTGYSLEELKGRSLKMLQGPETSPTELARMGECLRDGSYFEGTAINYRKDGSPYVVRWNISPLRNEEGVITHYVSVQQDMTEQRLSEQRGRMLSKALDATTDPVLVTDATVHIVFVNQAYANETGFDIDELIGKTPALLRSGEHDEAFYQGLRKELESGRDFKATFTNRRRDGTLFYFEQNISPLRDDMGRTTHYVSIGRDVSERVQKDRDLFSAATTDRLTGLVNRNHGEELLNKKFSHAVSTGSQLSIILCDIDHFKQVNDRFGHPAGDRVLKNVAKTLRGAVRATDPIVRWGGEEFMVILSACDQSRAIEVAEHMRCCVEREQDTEVGAVTLSLGLAALNKGETLSALITKCDKGLYASKSAGRNRLTVA